MSASVILPPAVALIGAGVLVPLVHGRLRAALLLAAPFLSLGLVWMVPLGGRAVLPYLDMELVIASGTRLGRLFATVFSVMAFLGGLFALNQRRALELAAAYIYAGAAIGVTFSGDLISLFVFWEVMAIASTLVIWSNGAAARRAGMRYGLMHLLGGAILMAGIAGHVAATGSTTFGAMSLAAPASWLILIGFLINAAAWPLSAWMPDAYPQSSWSGMVFLSAYTTKTAVFVLITGFAGAEVLIWVGMVMVFYGIIYAILENDMRRILAYSSANQVGFMIVGVGLGTPLALNGAAGLAVAHVLFKSLLVMAAGSVLLMTNRSKCSELGGLFRTMPLTTACGIVGALAISAFPLTSGFVTKSMITDSAAAQHAGWIWLLLTAASAGVFLHAGIKFPWFVFFQKDSGLRPADPPANMRAAMVLGAGLCIAIGVFPAAFYRLLPHEIAYAPYTAAHVVTQLELLLFSGLAFFLMLGWLKRTPTITLDADWLWRRPGAWLLRATVRGAAGAGRLLRGAGGAAAMALQDRLRRNLGKSGLLGRGRPTGTMAFWTVLMLAAFLMLGTL